MRGDTLSADTGMMWSWTAEPIVSVRPELNAIQFLWGGETRDTGHCCSTQRTMSLSCRRQLPLLPRCGLCLLRCLNLFCVKFTACKHPQHCMQTGSRGVTLHARCLVVCSSSALSATAFSTTMWLNKICQTGYGGCATPSVWNSVPSQRGSTTGSAIYHIVEPIRYRSAGTT
jgi:hypothetical protein